MPLPLLIPAAIKAAPWIMSGLSALGGLFGNKKKAEQQQQSQTNQTSSSNTNAVNNFFSQGSSQGYSRPVYDPLSGNLRDNLLQQYYTRANEGVDDLLGSTYFSNLRSINENKNRLQNTIAEQYGARGLGRSPAAANAQIQAENNRFGNIINLEGSLPQMRDKIMQDRLSQAGQYLLSLPVATESGQQTYQDGQQVTNSTTNGTMQSNSTATGNVQDSSGGGIGGGLQSLFTTLAGLYGNGAFSPQVTPGRTPPFVPQQTSFGNINPNFVLNSPFRFNSGLARN